MVSRRRISKDTESERNSNLVNQFLINFVGMLYRCTKNFKDISDSLAISKILYNDYI